jgi:hypothetical protein
MYRIAVTEVRSHPIRSGSHHGRSGELCRRRSAQLEEAHDYPNDHQSRRDDLQ